MAMIKPYVIILSLLHSYHCENLDCFGNYECPDSLACINRECINLCETACGRNADCVTKNHVPVCSCPSGVQGDPYWHCLEQNCSKSVDCDGTKRICIDGLCELASQFSSKYIGPQVPPNLSYFEVAASCTPESPCGPNGRCREQNGKALCRCISGHRQTKSGQNMCLEPPTERADPCVQTQCGTNAECLSRNGVAVCSCPKGFGGNPLIQCDLEIINCIADFECPATQTCINRACIDSCGTACGKNADCIVQNHMAVCSCPPSTTGDPYLYCEEISCNLHSDCSFQNSRSCINGLCQLQAHYTFTYTGPEVLKNVTYFSIRGNCAESPCGQHGRCRDDRAKGYVLCRCPEGHQWKLGKNQCNDPPGAPKPVTLAPISEATNDCSISVTKVKGQEVCSNVLIFEENFDDFNSANWTQVIKFADAPDYEFVAYVKDDYVLKVHEGLLYIRPTLLTLKYKDENFLNKELDFETMCTDLRNTPGCHRKASGYKILPPVISGRMNTKGKFSFLYGRVEIRAKLPIGDWIYPALYLNPEENAYGPDYDSGQMRIAYSLGNLENSTQLFAGLIFGETLIARNAFFRSTIANSWTNDFHVFELDWSPTGVAFKVDGTQYYHVPVPEFGFSSIVERLKVRDSAQLWKHGSKMAPFDQEFYLDVGVGVGGAQIEDSLTKPWKKADPKATLTFWRNKDRWYPTWGSSAVLKVDYIKVYSI